MAHRKEVFQSKVLQRLYPLPPKPEKEPSSPPAEFVLKKSSVKLKVGLEEEGTITGDGGITPSSSQPGRRMYTVLAPPAEYKTGAEGSVMLSQPAGINTVEDPADENTHESNEDGEGEGQRLRRRRRRRKGTTAPGGGTVAGQATDSNPGDPTMAPTPTKEEGERLSKNKRRKLKKKRHKEKLLSLGLMPRAAALEFTYQREGDREEEEEEDEEMRQRRAAEVMDFLRTTQEIYVSDRRLHVSSVVVEGLLTSLSNGTFSPAVLAQLHSLKSLVQQQDTERLAKALQELQNSSTMSPSEATAVVSLFQYWITDILPLQRQEDRPTNNTNLLVEPTNNTALDFPRCSRF